MAGIGPLFYIIVALILIGLLVVLQPIISNRKNNKSNNKPKGTPIKDTLILYGTQSGNSQLVATELQAAMEKSGYALECHSMLNTSTESIEGIKHLYIIISTYGEGEMPPQAEDFYNSLKQKQAGSLSALKYSICALGDSSYDYYCESGLQFDKVLSHLGAKAISTIQKCDEDFSESAQQWINTSKKQLLKQVGSSHLSNNSEVSVLSNNKAEYTATLIERSVLANDSDENTIIHLSLKANGNSFQYKAGDTIEVQPKNPASIVSAIATQLKLKDAKELQDKELTNVSKNTLVAYSVLGKNQQLKALLSKPEKLKAYLHKANVLDLINDYKINAPLTKILGVLPSLRKRVYSIASSPLVSPQQIDLCIKTIRYPFNNAAHEGAGSIYLNETTALQSTLSFTLKSNPNFTLTKSDAPIIMIATGTGIAPFRSFIQELSQRNATRSTWLIWGQKFKANYAMYHHEFEQIKTEGYNLQFTPCFSKDESEYGYVQEALKHQKQHLLQLLQQGAMVYLCGSQAMAAGVRDTFNQLLKGSATPSISVLMKSERWFEDIY
ncbi:flavodoxin domain-containing protein [Saccharicrinis aurantiacus]|uniref:flavodoxin domain-containing protein n=1 Tax=Saccharicrinis aurantiacus TaxID=1849719 RepID=UPI00094FC595|nr:sulfite reductase flavoprotein subunit alpha [Saccharicrinis aurantiacus]